MNNPDSLLDGPVPRRVFLGLAMSAAACVPALGFAAPARGRASCAEQTFFDWKPIGEKSRVAFGQGGNTLLLVAGGEALLVDCKTSPYGPILKRELKLGDAKLAAVVNTHHHADHTGGNHAFVGAVPVIAQELAVPRVLTQTDRYIATVKQAVMDLSGDKDKAAMVADDFKALHARFAEFQPKDFAPTENFKDERQLKIGGIEVRLKHIGPGHTDNDLFVHVPELNLVHAGDLLFYRRHPFIDRSSGADTAAWRRSLAAIIAVCDEKTVVIPGHGELCGVAGLREQAEYFDKVGEQVRKAVRDGKSRKDVASMKLVGYDEYAGGSNLALTLGAIYDEVASEKPPEAR